MERPFERLGRGLGLYLCFLGIANHRGLVSRNADRVRRALAIADSDFDRWLDRLSRDRLIELKSRPPFLVARLTAWPAVGLSEAEDVSFPSAKPRPIEEQGYSHGLSNNAEAIAMEDGGAGEGGEALLAEILDTLGESDPADFRRVLEVYSAETIRDALERVRRVPAERVRKSKTALFRYLLAKRN